MFLHCIFRLLASAGKAREERKGTLEMVYDYLGSNEVEATEQPTASPIFAPPASLAVSNAFWRRYKAIITFNAGPILHSVLVSAV